jgi:hypothetical protein
MSFVSLSKRRALKELESLIHFWKDSLAEHRLLMSPSAVYLVEQTIKNLEKLAALTAGAKESKEAGRDGMG